MHLPNDSSPSPTLLVQREAPNTLLHGRGTPVVSRAFITHCPNVQRSSIAQMGYRCAYAVVRRPSPLRSTSSREEVAEDGRACPTLCLASDAPAQPRASERALLLLPQRLSQPVEHREDGLVHTGRGPTLQHWGQKKGTRGNFTISGAGKPAAQNMGQLSEIELG